MYIFLTVISHISAINELSLQPLLAREQFHVNAFKAYASGDLPEACVQLEKSVVEYPRGYYLYTVFSMLSYSIC